MIQMPVLMDTTTAMFVLSVCGSSLLATQDLFVFMVAPQRTLFMLILGPGGIQVGVYLEKSNRYIKFGIYYVLKTAIVT